MAGFLIAYGECKTREKIPALHALKLRDGVAAA
jgi:hypothetical protein